jgi:hypothetical protein
VSRLGDEGRANLAPEFGANRDILQIWIRRRESPSGGAGLAKRCVHAAALAANERGQRVDVGRFEFRQLAVFEHQAWVFVLGRKSFQDIHRR